jgi:heme/copper-type cytochrome/quinol oxidase subunit 2
MECNFLASIISGIFFVSIFGALCMRFNSGDAGRIDSLKDKWYEFIAYIFIVMLVIILIIAIMTAIILLLGTFAKFISWILCNLHWCKCG